MTVAPLVERSRPIVTWEKSRKPEVPDMAINDVRNNDMMAHLMGALENGQDIGHYGRLVFVMVGRHFLEEGELGRYLTINPGFDEAKARALVQQVQQRDYTPPRRERILEWQGQQDFPICP